MATQNWGSWIRMGLATVALSFGGNVLADDAPSASPTFTKDIAPILHKNCAECHRQGQIGPMSLVSYDDVRPWAKSVKKTVAERSMPPWFADPAIGHFKDSKVLSAEQIALITKWVDQGAPKGEGEAPTPPEFKDNVWRMGTPDQVFEMPEPFTVADEVEDLYQVFVIPSGLTEDKWVVGTELLPSAYEVVHHILVFIAPGDLDVNALKEELSEEQADGQDGSAFEKQGNKERRRSSGMGAGLFAKFGPGTNPEIWHDGRGRKMTKGCNIIFQTHFHKTPGAGTAKIERSKLAVKYASGPVEHPITTAWIVNPTFRIPAGDPNYEAVSSFRFIDDGQIYALTPHLHMRGKDFHYEAVYPDGTKQTLLSVPKWNFNWQLSYVFQEPISIPKGTKIRAVAHWDNSKDNPNNPDATIDVSWGGPSTDEMMIGFMDYTYNRLKKHQGQYGLPEGLSPFGVGGDEKQGENFRKQFQERRKKALEERRAKQASGSSNAGE